MYSSDVTEIRKLGQKYAYSSLQMHENIARKAGFTGTDHKYLGFFIQKGKLTAGELAGLSGLTTGAVTGLIDRFEKKGLVKRATDPGDRRKVFIEPDSEKILALVQPFYISFQDESEELIASFSVKERAVIEAYLTKALALVIDTNTKLKLYDIYGK